MVVVTERGKLQHLRPISSTKEACLLTSVTSNGFRPGHLTGYKKGLSRMVYNELDSIQG